jgi:ParB-like chromosome segregation protein Spo0J
MTTATAGYRDLKYAPPLAPGTFDVPVDEITVGKRHRVQGDISDLRDSIARVGLLHPITLTVDRRLVAGAGRLQSHKDLGLSVIRATVRDLDDLQAELVEIDENLTFHKLTVLEEGRHFHRRRELLRMLGLRLSEISDSQDAKPATLPEVAAEKGIHLATVYRRMAAVEHIPDDVAEQIAPTRIANSPKDLAELGAMPAEDQRRIAEAVSSRPELRSVRQAVREVFPERTPVEPQERWDDGVAEHKYTVTAVVVVSLRVPNDDMRQRDGKVYPREAIEAEHTIRLDWGPDVREKGPAGLREIGGDIVKRLYEDEELRRDWDRIPRHTMAPT